MKKVDVSVVLIDIRGARGLNAEIINGSYEPTKEMCGGLPIYRKVGDSNKWLEFFTQTNKWYVKATTDKGRARGWMRITCYPPSRPEFSTSVCEVWDGSKWIAQSSVTIIPLKQRREEDRIAGARRRAVAVSVDIRGAVGPSAPSINGVYTPTDDLCGGWPVYKKEGDSDKWLEFVVATNEWYVKPTADRGRAEGWMCLSSDPPEAPELSREICEVWDGEHWTSQSSVTVLTAACAFENTLEIQSFCAEETRNLQARLNSLLCNAVGLLSSVSAERVDDGNKQLQEMLADLDERVLCLKAIEGSDGDPLLLTPVDGALEDQEKDKDAAKPNGATGGGGKCPVVLPPPPAKRPDVVETGRPPPSVAKKETKTHKK